MLFESLLVTPYDSEVTTIKGDPTWTEINAFPRLEGRRFQTLGSVVWVGRKGSPKKDTPTTDEAKRAYGRATLRGPADTWW